MVLLSFDERSVYMYCSNCGATIDDRAAVCVHCGVPTAIGIAMQQPYREPVDPDEKPNGGFIALSLLVPLVGIILGATEKSNGKIRAGKAYLTAGIGAMLFWLIFSVGITLFATFLPLIILAFSY